MNTLIRVFFRANLGFLLGWIVPLMVLLAASPSALYAANPSSAEVAALGRAISANLGTLVMYGHAPEPLGYATWIMWELWIWLGLLGGVMIILLAVRLTRAMEEDGIVELIRVTGISNRTPIVAAALTVLLASGLFGCLCALILCAQSFKIEEFELGPSVLSGIGIAAMLAAYGGIGLLAAQLTPTARAARATGLSALAITYAFRVIADVYDFAWLRWLSPLGWRHILDPYLDNNVWPLAVFALAIACLYAPALAFTRDVGAFWGARAFRPQTTRVSEHAFNPVSLHWRLNRAIVLWWALSTIAIAICLFALIGEMDSLATTGTEMMDSMAQLLGDTELSSIFVRMMGTLLGILLSCAAIQTALATLRDETTGTLSLEVTSGGPRYRPLVVDWATAVLAGAATALAAAPLAALVTDWSMRSTYGESTNSSEIARAAFWAVLDQLPPVIALAGFAILCVGLSTRLAPLAWTVLGISGVITYFGELFQFPEWLLNASVFAWAAHQESATQWTGALTLVGIGVVTTAAGTLLRNRRDLVCT